MRKMFAILVLASLPAAADAKCTLPVIEISGRVLHRNGEPVPNAVVGVSWTRTGLPQGPAMACSNADGAFFVRFQFNTYTKSSMFRGDVCRERVEAVSVSARTDTHRSEDTHLEVSNGSARVDLYVDPFRDEP
jgi:hypothetical protein